MYRQRQETTWPFLCVLGCLFILCLAAPRAWQRVAQHRSAAEILGQHLSTVDPAALRHAEVASEPASSDRLITAPAVEPTPIMPTAMVTVEEPRTAEPEPKVSTKYPEGPGNSVATDEGRKPTEPTPAPAKPAVPDESLPTLDRSALVANLPSTAPTPATPKTPPVASDELRVATRSPSTASKADRIPATAVPRMI